MQSATQASMQAVQALRTFTAAAAIALIGVAAAPADAAGVLVPRDGRAPVKLRSQRVTARLSDGLARTTVRQTFLSPHRGAIEAVYVFPVPEGAALVDVAMEVGGKRLEGLVVERQKARRVYDQIVRGKRDPALVEQIGRSKFRLSVFPVLQNEPTVVEITWVEQTPLTDGRYRYVYPLALAGDAARTEQDLTFDLQIASTAPLREVTSPTDGLSLSVPSAHAASASFERQRAVLDQDIVVEASVGVPKASLGVRTFRDRKGELYVAAVVTPPALTADQIIPRDVTLLLDVSGSMKGQKIQQARNAALYLVDNARNTDRVNVVRFNAAIDAFAEQPVPMTDENRQRMRAFVEDTTAGGSTALADALGFALSEPVHETRVRTIVLLSDGRPTVGPVDPAEILTATRDDAPEHARVFTFGVGGDVDEGLLRGISAATRGDAQLFRSGGEIEGRLSSFLKRTSTPALANLKVDAAGARLTEVYPRPVPDVFLGEQAVLTTRVRGEVPETTTVHATVAGKRIALTADVPRRRAPGGDISVLHLYARQKIDFLEQSLRLRRNLSDEAYYAALDRGAYDSSDEIVQEIVATSIDCGVQSAYASFLVLLPEDRARLDPRDLAGLQNARERAADARRDARGEPTIEEESAAAPPDGIEYDDVVIKDAKVRDHNESDTDMDDADSLGDPRFNSDAPFEGPGTNGVIGIAGGAGVGFGGRRGGRRNLRSGGGGRNTQSAVDLGLEWLKNHQSADGHWDPAAFESQCKLNRCGGGATTAQGPGSTSLVLLAFLGAGETHNSGEYKDAVKNGLRYLKNLQDSEGCFGSRTSPTFMTDHMWATLAMTEAYGLTGSRLFKESAQRAVNFVLRAQNPYLGWGPGVRTGVNDTSTTVLGMLVVKSAKLAELDVDHSGAFAGGLKWLDLVTDAKSGRVGNQKVGDADVEWRFPTLRGDALTAAAMLARIMAGQDPKENELIQKGADILAANRPEASVWLDPGEYMLRYFGTLALFQVGGDHFKQWNEALKPALVGRQRTGQGRDERGSWDPLDLHSAEAGGRVHATAIQTLCLEVYYRYGRVFGGSGPSRR